MKLLDRYIVKRLLSTFLFVVLILVLVITVIDLAEKTEKYIRNKLTAAQILSYYLDFIPWVANLITPITVFIATVYVTARMAGHTEIIAMLSSGMSFRRLLVPYFVGAFAIAATSFWLNGWVIPNANKSRLAFEVEYIKGRYFYDKKNIHIQVSPGEYLYMQSYNNQANVGYNFTLEKFDSLRLVQKLTAQRIEWDTARRTWRIVDWRIRNVAKVFDEGVAEADQRGFQMDSALAIHPREFENDYRKYDGMTLDELDEYIRILRARGISGTEVYEVEKYSRYAAPFTIFILTFMGVIVSSRKSRGGTGFQVALGFLLSFAFILFFMMFRTFAENGTLPPAISVWIPSLVFGGISVALYKYVPR